MKHNTFALALGGGGAKGVYQIGVWQALRELKIKYHAVIGTSIGAINGALMVQGDFHRAYEMWANMQFQDILNIPQRMIEEGKFVITNGNMDDFLKLQESIIKNKGVDTTPLRNMLEKYISEEIVRKKKIDFGIVGYHLKNFSPIELFKEEMKAGNFYDYLMASSALPGLKQVKVDGSVALDGGIHDNVPFTVAKRRGYKRIIAVDVSGVGRNRKPDVEGTETIYIKNSADLGSLFEVDQNLYLRNIQMGYRDTMKIFGKYSGELYTYIDDKRLKYKMFHYFMEHEECLIREVYLEKDKPQKFTDLLPERYRIHRDFIGSLIECAAISLKLESDKLYRFRDLIDEIMRKYKELSQIKKTLLDKGILDLILESIKQKRNLFHLPPMEYDLVASYLLKNKNSDEELLSDGVLSFFFQELYGARLLFLLVEKMGNSFYQ